MTILSQNTQPKGTTMRDPRIIKSNGFTLIEMLVVIAIIALLISMITPAVTNTLERAKTTTCMNNMRQTAAAMLQYAADNQGRLMFFDLPGHRDAADVPRSSWAGVLVVQGYLDAPLVSDRNDIQTGHVFWCPSGRSDEPWAFQWPDSPWDDNPGHFRPWAAHMDTDEGTRFVHTWFAINARTENPGWPFTRRWRVTDGPEKNVTGLRYADKTVIFHDGAWSVNGAANRLPARHGNPRSTTNFAFFDGRVENIRTRVFDVGHHNRDQPPETYPRFKR